MHIDELCDYCNVTKWTIKKYRRFGVVDPPAGYGRWAEWSDKHVRQVRKAHTILADTRVTLADIGENPAKYLGNA